LLKTKQYLCVPILAGNNPFCKSPLQGQMKKHFSSQRLFLIPVLICWIFVSGLLLYFDKAELHLLINGWNAPLADFFFQYYTEVGGSFPFWVAGTLLLWRYSAAIMVVATQLIATLIVTPLKRLIDEDRPRVLFEQLQITLHQVEGVRLHSSHSFPSGHTAAAFALFFSLAVIARQPALKFLMFLLAVLAGFSRVYLSQHFTEDVLAGSVIGVLSVLIYCRFFQEKVAGTLGEKGLIDWWRK
jgi:membrane-associated phospholipid phosphatase